MFGLGNRISEKYKKPVLTLYAQAVLQCIYAKDGQAFRSTTMIHSQRSRARQVSRQLTHAPRRGILSQRLSRALSGLFGNLHFGPVSATRPLCMRITAFFSASTFFYYGARIIKQIFLSVSP